MNSQIFFSKFLRFLKGNFSLKFIEICEKTGPSNSDDPISPPGKLPLLLLPYSPERSEIGPCDVRAVGSFTGNDYSAGRRRLRIRPPPEARIIPACEKVLHYILVTHTHTHTANNTNATHYTLLQAANQPREILHVLYSSVLDLPKKVTGGGAEGSERCLLVPKFMSDAVRVCRPALVCWSCAPQGADKQGRAGHGTGKLIYHAKFCDTWCVQS